VFNPSHVLRNLTVDIKSSFSARTRPRHGLPGKCFWISDAGKDLSPQCPQWLSRPSPVFFAVGNGVTLEMKRPVREANHLHIVPNLGMRGAIPPISHWPS